LDLSTTRLYGTPDDRKKEAPRVCSNREGLRGVARTGAVMKLDAMATPRGRYSFGLMKAWYTTDSTVCSFRRR
jgi:hypothetical protein